jgi:Big-like domain-containing protein
MAIFMSLGGNSAGDGFLIVPLGTTYDADLSIHTDAGNMAVTLQASPNPAGLVFSQTNLNISPAPTVVQVHAMTQSNSRGDTTIQVLDSGSNVVASFTVTAIKHPKINFKGRFEARFATDGAFFNTNPIYSATVDTVVPPGWTWGLEGEPNFVPTVGNIPENLETPVGRVVRLNNPVALRSHADPVASTIASITGETAGGTETFTAGDPVISQPVNFGADTYLAGNNPFGTPKPEESWSAAAEPMALFEIRIGNGTMYFRGGSNIGPFVAKFTSLNQHTRNPDSRPIADGNLYSASAELTEFGLPDLTTFSETRIDQLVTDFNALPAGPSTDRRNLVRRIGHLLSAVSSAKRTAVMNANPGAFTTRAGTLPQGWPSKEVYTGKVDANLHAQPGGSAVITYFTEFSGFDFQWNPFGFHSDELCGHHKGSLSADLNMHGGHIGDPHCRTVNGTNYDFQAVGEFTLLRDGNHLEVQVRQTPVPAATPVPDQYTGLTSCVSINTAAAARIGRHHVSLQLAREGKLLQFYLDGKPSNFPAEAGLDLAGGRVTSFDAGGETGLRIDYDDGTVVIFTPWLWTTHNVWLINVDVSNTKADEGVMGFIPKQSWLPRLRNGQSVGPMPASLTDRHKVLYKTFADSWRVTDATSLFVYSPGTSTKTFTDHDWPADKPPCKLKPEFQIPGLGVLKGMPIEEAKRVCHAVTAKDLNAHCVFDVATTGDPIFAKGYQFAQDLRLYGTSVKLTGRAPAFFPGRVMPSVAVEAPREPEHRLVVIATVAAMTPGRPAPTGVVNFFVDGVPLNRPAQLDGRGRASITIGPLKSGEHRIRATYAGGGQYEYHASSSPALLYTVK